MEFYVDIADLDEVEKVAEYFPIQGFTTNPKILSVAKKPVEEMMPEYRKYVEENDMKIFFQVTGKTAEEMFAEAEHLHTYFGEHLIVKIPAIREGYKAVRLCKKAGIPTLVTVVHSVMQAVVAAAAGAEYVAPYITHIDNLGVNSIKAVESMLKTFEHGGYSCKVLGASFRSVEQIKLLAEIGCQAVTLTPEMFERLIQHPSTDESMHMFYDAGVHAFANRQIDDLIDQK